MGENDYFNSINNTGLYQGNPMQQMNVQQNIAAGNVLREMAASDMAFVAAIINGVILLLFMIAGIMGTEITMLFLSIPFIISTVEAWVTVGTARWGKSGIKRGGMIAGKVFSIIGIVFTGGFIVFLFICACTWSVIAKVLGTVWDEILNELLGISGVYSSIADIGAGMIFLIFFISIIPLVSNILLQVQLNVLRNKVMAAAAGKLTTPPRTMFLAVLMFIVGIPLLGLAGLLFFVGTQTQTEIVLMGMAYIVASLMYFYGGVIVIRCGVVR